VRRTSRGRAIAASGVLRAAVVFLGTFLLAGCASVVRIAYNNSDVAVRMVANEYFDLQGEQADLFKVRFTRLHEWHRLEELPRYAQALDSAALRVQRGATRADVAWAVATIRARYQALASQAVDESVAVLVTLTPGNIAALETKFATSNRKFEKEYLSGDQSEREAARIDTISDRLEEWLGSISTQQRRLIADYVRTQPANQALRLADRKVRQQELVEILRQERNASALRASLRAFFVDYEAQRGAEYARAWREWQERLVTLIAEILAVASPSQREYAAARLTRYADDFRALAEEGRERLPSGTRAAQETAHPGT
jgi:Family of unknown function (DUF6279)